MTEAERQEDIENLRRTIEENDKWARKAVIRYGRILADYEAKIAQLKQEEGDHSEEIATLEDSAKHVRKMIRIYKYSLGEGEFPG